eukprot:GFYU01027529.1.p1 GENE.GFYU01027529.1~~GFYU01027529.1.p1  ORF type:complete len:312 (+),score=69.06 GFYU01027529.1:92-1027(+)
MTEYGKEEYWDAKYRAKDTCFDWYLTYTGLKEQLLPYLEENSRILNVGSGNSRLSANIYDDGFQHITNVDISEVVTVQMKRRNEARENMKWYTMDAKKLDFPSESFDLIVDKGTLDSLLCGDRSFQHVNLMTKEVYRVLRPGGHYVCISFGTPDTRMEHFEQYQWAIEHRQVAKSLLEASYDMPASACYHIYICAKPHERALIDDDDDDEDEDAAFAQVARQGSQSGLGGGVSAQGYSVGGPSPYDPGMASPYQTADTPNNMQIQGGQPQQAYGSQMPSSMSGNFAQNNNTPQAAGSFANGPNFFQSPTAV